MFGWHLCGLTSGSLIIGYQNDIFFLNHSSLFKICKMIHHFFSLFDSNKIPDIYSYIPCTNFKSKKISASKINLTQENLITVGLTRQDILYLTHDVPLCIASEQVATFCSPVTISNNQSFMLPEPNCGCEGHAPTLLSTKLACGELGPKGFLCLLPLYLFTF